MSKENKNSTENNSTEIENEVETPEKENVVETEEIEVDEVTQLKELVTEWEDKYLIETLGNN